MYPIIDKKFTKSYAKTDLKYLLAMVKRMLPEYVFDTAKLEGNPFTFPEVKTLLDGITVGGHKVSDAQQILNLKSGWELLISSVSTGKFRVSEAMMNSLHSRVAYKEALEWGKFRSSNVYISGTNNYACPSASELNEIFASGAKKLNALSNPVERAITMFLWGSLNQFYFDGNKRISRLMANGILLSEHIGVFNIKASDITKYNGLMVEFYNTKKGDRIAKFLEDRCIVTFKM